MYCQDQPPYPPQLTVRIPRDHFTVAVSADSQLVILTLNGSKPSEL